jgi:hypothetical protein
MVVSSVTTESTMMYLAQTSSTVLSTSSSSSRLGSSASSSSLPSSLQSASSSGPVTMTLAPISTSTPSAVPIAPSTRDSLEDPTYFTFPTTSNQISRSYVTINDSHNDNTCVGVTSTDRNDAGLNAEASISVQAGTQVTCHAMNSLS